ncbi:MAG TPA: DUF2794 domain-containing protein [Thermohalobaculum sp.]|nr:DUF2794 domain-containing protein [Thermohalobaculum sp.]
MSFERILNSHGGARPAEQTFSRYELSLILNVYGRMVAAGKWRDYAIDHHRDRAVFSIFRGTAEQALYRVEKVRGENGKQPGFSVVGMDGCILGRGADLQKVLRVLERKLIRLVD